MNIREISKQELNSTLETIVKIFKEHDKEPGSSVLADFSPNGAAEVLPAKGFRFFSAFENGGEIGTIALKNNHICILAVKKYAQRRGVGSQLIRTVLNSYPKGTLITVNAEEDVEPFYAQLGFNPDNALDPVVNKGNTSYVPMHLEVH